MKFFFFFTNLKNVIDFKFHFNLNTYITIHHDSVADQLIDLIHRSLQHRFIEDADIVPQRLQRHQDSIHFAGLPAHGNIGLVPCDSFVGTRLAGSNSRQKTLVLIAERTGQDGLLSALHRRPVKQSPRAFHKLLGALSFIKCSELLYVII